MTTQVSVQNDKNSISKNKTENATQPQPMPLTHSLLFFGALTAYRKEGNPWTWSAFSQRLRLTSLSAKGWAWAVAATVSNIVLYMALYTVGLPVLEALAKLFPDPAILNRVLGDSTSFAGFPLNGCLFHFLLFQRGRRRTLVAGLHFSTAGTFTRLAHMDGSWLVLDWLSSLHALLTPWRYCLAPFGCRRLPKSRKTPGIPYRA